ncbi:MAG: addiction module protein [Planctomycetes bacterium]|nr:addiction module protein [Planctomycetota bacterium]
MTADTKQILKRALSLSPIERAELIEKLFHSFEFSDRETIDSLWADEAEKRIDAFEEGSLPAISTKKVFKKIEKNSMDVKFLLAAEKEFEETVIYYNSQSVDS